MTDTEIELEDETILAMQAHGWAELVDGKWRTTTAFDEYVDKFVADMEEE